MAAERWARLKNAHDLRPEDYLREANAHLQAGNFAEADRLLATIAVLFETDRTSGARRKSLLTTLTQKRHAQQQTTA